MAFVLKNTQPPQVIRPSNDLPVVVNAEEISDYEGNFDYLLSLECYCNFHVVDFIRNSTTTSEAKKIRKIDIHFAPNDIEYYKRKASASVVRKVLVDDDKIKSSLLNQNQNNSLLETGITYQNVSRLNMPASAYSNNSTTIGTTLSPTQVLQAVTNASSHRLERATNIFQGTIKVGSFDLTEIDIDSIEVKKKIQFRNIESSVAARTRNQIQEEQNINSDAFSSIYRKMIIGGRDPAVLFKDQYLKTSQKKEQTGQITNNKKRKTEEQHVFEPIFLSFTNQIRSLSKKTIEFGYYNEQETIRRLKTNVNVSHNKLKSIAKGNTVHVLFIARSENDKKIESFSFPFNISTIDDQIQQKSRRYDLATTRLNDNTSVLSIGNNSVKKELSVNMYGKKVSSLIPFEYAYYKDYSGTTVLPGNKVIYKDGILNKSNRASNKNFNAYDNVYYRTTFNLNRKQYFNADSITDKRRKTTDNTPHLVVLGEISNKADEFISVSVNNISSNVKALRVLKKKFKGDTQHISNNNNFEYLVSENGDIQDAFQIVTARNLNFVDYNVYRTSVYKYYVECMMSNGERKIAPNFFIERFEERSNIVEIKNIQLTHNPDSQEAIESTRLNNFHDMNKLVKNVIIDFDVIQNETESEKLLSTLFGDLFDLYKEQLQQIREGIQPLVCSIEIIRHNRLTGDSTTLGTIKPDEQGKCRFVDESCPIFSDVTYKFKPRAIPAGDLIDIVNEQIPLYAKKDVFRSGRLVAGSQMKAISDSRNNVLSTVGRKYSKRNTFLKGLVESGKASLARQGGSDVFAGSSTGDIEYKRLSGIDAFKREKSDLTIKNSTIVEVREINSERDKRLAFKNRGSQIQRSYEDIQGYRKDGRLIPGSQGQIIRSLPETKLINFKLCDLTFDLIGNDFFVDFYAVLVKENDFIYLDGIMHSTDDIANEKSYSYLFEHEGSFGLIEYYLVPIYKDGFLGVPKLVGANEIT